MEADGRRRGLAAAAGLLLLALAGGVLHLLGDDPPTTPDAPDPAGESASKQTRRRVRRGDPGRIRERVALPPAAPLRPATERRPELPPGLGRLEGFIGDAVGNEPLADVRVTVLHPEGTRVAVTHTNEDGRYELSQLPHDVPLLVRLEARRHLTGLLGNVRLPAYQVTARNAYMRRSPMILIELDSKGPHNDLDGLPVQLLRGGRVVDHTVVDNSPEGRAARWNMKELSLDHDEVLLYAPEFGPLEVRTGANAHFASSPGIPLVLTPGGGDRKLKVQVSPGGELAVRVIDAAGVAVRGATVTVGADGFAPLTATSDAEGHAVFRNVTIGPRFEVHAQVPETNLVGWTRASARLGYSGTVNVTVHESHALALVVLDPEGNPVPGVLTEVAMAGGGVVLRGRTDDDGSVTLAGLPPGRADVTIEPESLKRRVLDLDTSAPAGSLEVHRVQLAQPDVAVVNGVVRDAAGRRVAGAKVRAVPSGRVTVCGDDGVFRLSSLPPGREQRIIARADDYRMAPGSPPTVVPRAGRDVGVEVLMVRRPGATGSAGGGKVEHRGVRGIVKTTRGEPVVGARIRIGGAETTTDLGGDYDIPRARFVRHGEHSTATLEVLPPAGILTAEFVDLETGSTPVVLAPEVVLRTRPFARIAFRPSASVGSTPLHAFSVVSEVTDLSQGRRTAALEEISGVTYDGYWPLLPPMDEWRTRGTARVAIVAASPLGPLVERIEWRMRPDDEPVFDVEFEDSFENLRLDSSSRRRLGSLAVSLESSPREVWLRVPSDGVLSEDEIDPLSRTSIDRALRRDLDKSKRVYLARGVWRYAPLSTSREKVKKGTGAGTFDTSKGRIRFQ